MEAAARSVASEGGRNVSYLLEVLGRGLLGRSLDAFRNQLPTVDGDRAGELRRRLAQCPESLDLRVRLARLHLEAGRFTAARKLIETDAARGERPAQVLLACALDALGDTTAALTAFERLSAADPADPSAIFVVGLIHERCGDRPAAATAYHESLRRCPRLRNAHERLAALALRDGRAADALDHYQALATLDPGEITTELTVATLHLMRGDPQAAADAYQRALLIEPQCTEEAGTLLDDLKDDAALTHTIGVVEKMIETYPGVAEFHVQLGDLHVKAGNDGGAVAAYATAIELQPGYLEATVKLGAQHYRRGRFEQAARIFGRAVELNDRLLITFVGLSLAQRSLGKPVESRSTLDLAVGLEPNSTLLFFESARLHLLRSRQPADTGESDPALQVGDRREPAEGRTARPHPSARRSGGNRDMGDDGLMAALRRFRQGLINAPNDASLHFAHGLLLRQLGEPVQALQEFRTSIEIDPEFGRAQLRVGLSELEMGDADAALDSLRRALLPTPDATAQHYDLALLFSQGGRFDAAVEQFESVDWRTARRRAFRENLLLSLQHVGLVDRPDAAWVALDEIGEGVDWSLRGPIASPIGREE